jgi:hypothetical protein
VQFVNNAGAVQLCQIEHFIPESSLTDQFSKLFQTARPGGANTRLGHPHRFSDLKIRRFIDIEVKQFDQAAAAFRQPVDCTFDRVFTFYACDLLRNLWNGFVERLIVIPPPLDRRMRAPAGNGNEPSRERFHIPQVAQMSIEFQPNLLKDIGGIFRTQTKQVGHGVNEALVLFDEISPCDLITV